MADRAVVRQGSVVSLGLGAVLALAALGHAPAADDTASQPPPGPRTKADPAAKAPAAVPLESRPYKIRAWVAIDPRARIDARGRETLVAGWKTMVRRFVGAPWDLEVAEGDGPLATHDLNEINAGLVIPQAKGFDKAWVIKVEPDGGGFAIVGREFDAATAQVGLLGRRTAPVLADGPRALLRLAMDLFAPSGEIGEGKGKLYKVRVQGAMLPAATPEGEVISVGSAFRPTRIFYKPEGGVQRLDVIPRTYLRVDMIEGGVATCSVLSALGNPLTNRVVGKAKLVAVGVKPTAIPTRLRFTFTNPDNPNGPRAEERPAAGYDVIARPAPDGIPRAVGTTDREGRLVLEPGFSEGLVILRLMAAGVEPLTEFPIMPGEQVEEKLIQGVDPKAKTITVESELEGLRDEIVDLIAVRQRLEARIKNRVEADTPNWDEVRFLLDEFRKLPGREGVEARLTKLDERLASEQKQSKRNVRTKTAQGLLGDTRSLIERYLDDEMVNAYADGLERYTAQSNAATGAAKNKPKAPPLPMGKAAVVAMAGQSAGPVDFAPPGAGFRVTMPGTPVESTSKGPDGTSDIRSFLFNDPAKGAFLVMVADYPVAISEGEVDRVIATEGDRMLKVWPNATTLRDQRATISGFPGREFSIEGRDPKSGLQLVVTCRMALVNSQLYSATVTAPRALAEAQTAQDFLKSFQIAARGSTPPQAGGAVATSPPPAAPPNASIAQPSPATPKPAAPKAPSPAARPKTGGGQPF